MATKSLPILGTLLSMGLSANPNPGRLRHRNYYERVTPNDREPASSRECIATNPLRWMEKHDRAGAQADARCR